MPFPCALWYDTLLDRFFLSPCCRCLFISIPALDPFFLSPCLLFTPDHFVVASLPIATPRRKQSPHADWNNRNKRAAAIDCLSTTTWSRFLRSRRQTKIKRNQQLPGFLSLTKKFYGNLTIMTTTTTSSIIMITGEKKSPAQNPRLSFPRRLTPTRLGFLMTVMMVVVGRIALGSWQDIEVIARALHNDYTLFKDTVKTATTTTNTAMDPSFLVEQEQLKFFHQVKTILNGEYHNVSTSAATSILAAVCDYVLREAASLDAIKDEDIIQSRPVITINCSNPNYGLALTGQTDVSQKYIIDIVIFGFDVDYLEMRLAEHYDIVDKFLIIEQDHNHRGLPKPYFILDRLFQNETNNRFAQYMDKIEIITDKVDNDVSKGAKGWVNDSHHFWDIEAETRKKPIQHLQQTLFVNNPTLHHDQVYVIQNDGDEIMTRKALSHFKHCELHPNFPTRSGIEALSTSFKLNVAWVQETYDMRYIKLSGDDMPFEKLRQVLWRLGPSIWRWQDVDKAGHTKRGKAHGRVHLGLGAANHFSSPLHPVIGFVKEISTVDSARMFPEGLQKENSTLQDIIKSQLAFWCTKITDDGSITETFPFRHSSIFGKDHYEFLESTLPWVVKVKPYRYPWLYRDGILQQQLDLATEVCGHVAFIATPVVVITHFMLYLALFCALLLLAVIKFY
jgi:Glycosyltransferase family 17